MDCKEKEKIIIPPSPSVCEMKTSAFVLLYYDLIAEYGLKGAYKKLEDEHQKMFGVRRYSSYDSFRMIRKRFLRKETLLRKKRLLNP